MSDLAKEMQEVIEALQLENAIDEQNERARDGLGAAKLDPFRAEYRRGVMYGLQKMKRVLIVHAMRQNKPYPPPKE
ncbi:hypothetical protein WDW89_02410 [Deltaproteobacteria bacterium TL4]